MRIGVDLLLTCPMRCLSTPLGRRCADVSCPAGVVNPPANPRRLKPIGGPPRRASLPPEAKETIGPWQDGGSSERFQIIFHLPATSSWSYCGARRAAVWFD